MSTLNDHIKEMISVSGLSGFEEPIRNIIDKAWKPYADELSISKLGSLHGLRKGNSKSPRKSILVATHMDAIGLMVTEIHEGLLKFTGIGGIDSRILPGQEVIVHGTQELAGYIVQPPIHTLPEENQSGVVPMNQLLIDTGLSLQQVSNKVKIGDLISFATMPIEMNGKHLSGHSLDNRASVAVLTETLKMLDKRKHEWDVWAVATSQEEETLGGAITSGYQLRPDIAVVIDVTFGKSPGTSSSNSYKLDKGPTLDLGPNTHLKLFEEFKKLARQLELPHQIAVYSQTSGTDAMRLQVSAEGIATMLLGIPLRYMHTPIEMIQIKDVERTARLLTEFICQLDDNFMDKLAWHIDDDKEK